MSAEILRQAAALMREEPAKVRRPYGRDERVAVNVADWLDAEADEQERLGSPAEPNVTPAGAFAYSVARAYLGDPS